MGMQFVFAFMSATTCSIFPSGWVLLYGPVTLYREGDYGHVIWVYYALSLHCNPFPLQTRLSHVNQPMLRPSAFQFLPLFFPPVTSSHWLPSAEPHGHFMLLFVYIMHRLFCSLCVLVKMRSSFSFHYTNLETLNCECVHRYVRVWEVCGHPKYNTFIFYQLSRC